LNQLDEEALSLVVIVLLRWRGEYFVKKVRGERCHRNICAKVHDQCCRIHGACFLND
jgi:hypothetical protein